MMAKKWFKLFSICVLFSFASCGTAVRSTANTETKPAAIESPASPFPYELSSPEPVDGSLVLLSIQLPEEYAKSRVSADFEGTELSFYPAESKPGTFEAVLGVPYNHKPGPAFITVKIGDGLTSRSMLVPMKVVAGDYPSEVLKVDQRKVVPKPKDLVRIKKEVAEVVKAYSNSVRKKFWHGPFQLPINSVITSPYGGRRVFNGELKSFHGGLDLKAAEGTPIHAAAPGIVILSKDLFYSGNTVLIDHGYGVVTMYGHMSKLKVKKGAKVKTGDLLGLSGMTGRVTGPHLHWQAYIHKIKVNPLDLTKVMR